MCWFFVRFLQDHKVMAAKKLEKWLLQSVVKRTTA